MENDVRLAAQVSLLRLGLRLRLRSKFNGISTTSSTICAPTECFSLSRPTGKERDAESGNDYFGARYYTSSMGRFMSPDWSAKASPVPYATFGNPQSLNLYSYMRNNPLSGTDRDGHLGCGFLWLSNCPTPPPTAPPPPPAPKPPTPQQATGATPTVILPGPKYPTAQTAAVKTIQDVNPKSIKEDREYVSRAVQNADGSFGVVPPAPVGQAGGILPPVPDGTANAAEIHTHGGPDPGFDNEHFSGTDRDTARGEGVPSYLGTPAGSIQKFDPATNQTTVIQQPQQ
jgi:RHS repeat-associated protein